MTKSKLHNALLAVTLASGLFAGAGSAYATPGLVFTGTNSIEFDLDSLNPPPGPGSFVVAGTNETQLEWVELAGDTEAHSFLRILPPANTGVAITSDFGWVDVAQIQHENNVIPVSSFDFTVDVIDNFTLAGATFALTGTDSLPQLTLNVDFDETTNDEPCPGPNPLGSVCDDIFRLGGNLDLVLGSFLFTDALGEEFILSFRILAGADIGSFFDDANNIIYTAEDFISNLFIQARIDQVEVPEPASLALLGIGLAGLPLFTVRRRAKKADTTSA